MEKRGTICGTVKAIGARIFALISELLS